MTTVVEPHSKPAAKGYWVFLLATWAVATAFNLAKPFHMDDTAGLLIAEAISRNPLHPMGELLNWLDTAEPIFVTNQPHLFFYLMAATMWLFGNSELVMHLFLSAFSLLAIFATYGLMRRFVPQHALWATSVSFLGPGFLINQNVMTDVPLLSMLCLSALLICRTGANKPALAFAVFSMALLTKYTALFLFPAMIWGTMRRRPVLVWAVLPVFALVGWSLFNLFDYGQIHILNRPSNVGGLFPSPKLGFTLVCNLGLFALPIAIILMLRDWFWINVFVFGFAVFFLAETLGLGHPLEYLMLPNSMLFAGATVAITAAGMRSFSLLGMVWKDRKEGCKNDEIQGLTLSLWLLVGALFLATFPPFMASRHALLLMPPLVILALATEPRVRGRAVGIWVVAIWALVGAFVAANDIGFARFYRDMAPVMAQRANALSQPGAQIYTRGHWGWQWYAANAGMAEYDSVRSELQVGDILVDPVGISSQLVSDLEDFEILAVHTQEPGLFSVLDTHRFYASGAIAQTVFATGPARQIRILRKSR